LHAGLSAVLNQDGNDGLEVFKTLQSLERERDGSKIKPETYPYTIWNSSNLGHD